MGWGMGWGVGGGRKQAIVVMLGCGGGVKGGKCSRGAGGKAREALGLVHLGPHIGITHGGSN